MCWDWGEETLASSSHKANSWSTLLVGFRYDAMVGCAFILSYNLDLEYISNASLLTVG